MSTPIISIATTREAVSYVWIQTGNRRDRFARIAYVHGEWQGFVKGRGLVAFSPVRWKVVKAVVRLARAKVKALSAKPISVTIRVSDHVTPAVKRAQKAVQKFSPSREVHNPKNVRTKEGNNHGLF